ncbi:MAG: hypothetical protein COS17_03535 [Elusimicrobia bacterium CG02_land_8_20_14_3_00_37_13]|nr:MAG: hypothetical protein COS17_03535 [Elusimicrobia bacterium CG02_land_8_20_14_3_00_37_13]
MSSYDWKNKYEITWTTTTQPMVSQTRTLTGLWEGTTYYIRMWTTDEVSENWSPISNGATAQAEFTIVGIDIIISESTWGVVNVGDSTMTVTAITVNNTGNVSETYRIRCATTTPGGSPWSMGGTQDHNVFVLKGVFKSTAGVTSEFNNEDIIWSTNTLSTSNIYAVNGSTYTGTGVPPTESRNIWFKFDMPLTTSATYQQSIGITIGAQQ